MPQNFSDKSIKGNLGSHVEQLVSGSGIQGAKGARIEIDMLVRKHTMLKQLHSANEFTGKETDHTLVFP